MKNRPQGLKSLLCRHEVSTEHNSRATPRDAKENEGREEQIKASEKRTKEPRRNKREKGQKDEYKNKRNIKLYVQAAAQNVFLQNFIGSYVILGRLFV